MPGCAAQFLDERIVLPRFRGARAEDRVVEIEARVKQKRGVILKKLTQWLGHPSVRMFASIANRRKSKSRNWAWPLNVARSYRIWPDHRTLRHNRCESRAVCLDVRRNATEEVYTSSNNVNLSKNLRLTFFDRFHRRYPDVGLGESSVSTTRGYRVG